MKALIILLCLLISACSAKYKGWEYVRVEYSKPSDKCEYKVQEACSLIGAGCYKWYKKRATKFNADTVVITQTDKGQLTNATGLKLTSGDQLIVIADYYKCN